MLFDFDTFRKIVEQCYEPGPYSLGEVLVVFKYYFYHYEKKFGKAHPHIRMEQIRRIAQKMPYLDEERENEVFSCVYQYIIDRHFSTRYTRCDYNINHFFSGKIRELRYHETERM